MPCSNIRTLDPESEALTTRLPVEESGFMNKLEYGDDFLIRDLLARRYATLNIPPFFNG